MSNKKMILGIVAGAAALAVVGILIAKRNKAGRFSAETEEAKANFRSKLHELQRKAQREYRDIAGDGADIINAAKDRANEWVNSGNA